MSSEAAGFSRAPQRPTARGLRPGAMFAVLAPEVSSIEGPRRAWGRRPQLPARHEQNGPVIAVERGNWPFAGSLRVGKRAAAIMSPLHSARINEHDPYAYCKDVLDRLSMHPASRIDELLPHRWSRP